ncbi:MAG TPA: recombinase RecA [Candidatus Paceibacterota bacterium]|nr:recombinase RecA [Candidatus Paceibacterota bacterium]HPP16863.1 recombinase RecA [Candidatus Paceibacterota bacterium]
MAKQKKTEDANESKEKKEDILESTIKDIQSKFGEGAIMKLGEAPRVDVEVIPTGSISLDLALGVGGMPRGRIIEIYGPESSGKTTLALHIVASAQKQGGKAAFIDAEHALDPEYAKRIGVKTDELLISQPDNGEEALNIMEQLVRSGSIDVIVVDSVAALTPRAEIEGEMGAQHIGLQARLMSQALRKITAIAAKTKTVIIFINQIRMQVGIMFGNPETTPGGRALKFYSSVRIDIRRTAQIKKGEDIIGSRIKVKVVKNKVAPPFKIAEFDIMYNEGISKEGDLINTGVKTGIIQRSGNSYIFGETKLGTGIDNAKEFLKQNPKIANEIDKAIRQKALKEGK